MFLHFLQAKIHPMLSFVLYATNAFLQRPKRAGVVFAPFAEGMAAGFGLTVRIC